MDIRHHLVTKLLLFFWADVLYVLQYVRPTATLQTAIRHENPNGVEYCRILIVNGHGGNQPAGAVANELMIDSPHLSIKFHNWWSAPKTWAKVQSVDPSGSHANWMENYPWTRLAHAPAPCPATPKPAPDMVATKAAEPVLARELLGDGAFGGDYQKDDAVMLDDRGFLAETNATNLFLIRDGVLCTPFGHACLPGITRAYTLDLARELGIPVQEGDFSLTQLYTADEAFTTGTMGGLAHIAGVDGRRIGPAERQGPGPLTLKLQEAYPSRIPFVTLPFS